jgi:MYXO-CTERM domain-containing protein
MGAGGSTAAGGKSSGGCGCDVGGSARTRPAFWANLLAGLAVTAARRRRRSKRRGKGAAKTAKPNRAVDERCVPEHDQDGFPYAILRDLAALPIFDDDQAYDAKRVWQKHVSSGCGCCDLPAKDPRR